jgi:uncharacterized SAM-binding protein YcdF (DUF218 family)
MFVLKKIACSLLAPPGVILALLVLGLVRLGGGRGRVLLLLAASLLYLLSTAPGMDLLVVPLESRFPPLADPRPTKATAIVVLAAGGQEVPGTPVHAALGAHSMARLVEGVRLWRLLDGQAKLILAGGSAQGGTPVAWLMAETAEGCLGVSAQSLVTEPQGYDTGHSARLLAPSLRAKRFILVTSALHMPRSVADFRARGLSPVPAPTDYLQGGNSYSLYSFLPSGATLYASGMAIHEWLGLLWQRAAGLVARQPRKKDAGRSLSAKCRIEEPNYLSA